MDALSYLCARQPLIKEVRGLGLMIGVDFESAESADAVEQACFRRGALVLRAGDAAIRIAPPLVISSPQAAAGVRLFEEACAEVASSA
jgi:4-aminobutyrate aminotransferase